MGRETTSGMKEPMRMGDSEGCEVGTLKEPPAGAMSNRRQG
jgi:hypothetical protein